MDEIRTNSETDLPERLRPVRARPLGDLIGKMMDPACRRRGFATADLIADWPDIVGERYGERVRPERLIWPRSGRSEEPEPATLVVHTDGATALFLSHDLPQVIERINGFFGWAAVGRIRIMQRPVQPPRRRLRPVLRPLSPSEEAEIEAKVAPVTNPRLREALSRLGRAVVARNR